MIKKDSSLTLRMTLLIFLLTANVSLATDKSQINWFNATSPAERKNGQTLLEWNVNGGSGLAVTIDCEMGKIRLKNPASKYPYECGESINFGSGEGTYALALEPLDNQNWATVLFTLSLFNNIGSMADEKSFSVGFNPPKYTFNDNLYLGLIDNDGVRALQRLLTAEKIYSGPVNGNFFQLTLVAVKKYQKQNGIKNTGFVGQITRTILNK